MKALISPNENNRIAEVATLSFDVAKPLYWVDCSDDVTTEWTYVDGAFIAPPLPAPPTAEQNKSTASNLLSATDWTTIADVGNPQMANPYLSNQADFIVYRNIIRQYAVYPIAGNINWAVLPTEVWKTV